MEKKPKKRMPEKEIERKLKKKIEAMGCMCLKFESPGYTGVPDRIILMPGGEVIFAELKATGKKERPRQKLVQEQFRRLGFMVFETVDSEEKIEQVCQTCRAWLPEI